MREQQLTPNQTLWFVATSLIAEEAMELSHHWEHDGYAGALVMQSLILALYPEVSVPMQRDRTVEDWLRPAI